MTTNLVNSSSDVFQISNSLSSTTPPSPSSKSKIPTSQSLFPNYLTPLEFRASILLFHKLLSSSSISVPNTHNLLANILNQPDDLCFLSDKEYEFLKPISAYCSVHDSVLIGICALLDHRCKDLSTIVDAIAALSCEALNADIASSSIVLLVDSCDGLSDKDKVGVASDIRVFLNNSELLGKKYEQSILNLDAIPEIHASLRYISRKLHQYLREFLNSLTVGTGTRIVNLLTSLVGALCDLGKSSWCRANLILKSLNEDPFIFRLREMFYTECPVTDKLKELQLEVLCNSIQAAENGDDKLKFVHDVYILSDLVRTIISWEATVSFVSLSLISGQFGTDLSNEKSSTVEVEVSNSCVADNAKANGRKQNKKKKKKKVVMGKGTNALMQFLRDRLPAMVAGEIEKFVHQLLSILDPKDAGYLSLLEKIKDIVDSDESGIKLPKGTRDFANEQMAIREKAFSIASKVFKKHGATALDTPDFELRKTLMRKYGEDSKLIYDLADQGGELCSLRYDLTVPFARYVAMNGLTSFKRYQIGKVHRREATSDSNVRYREFYQCDFDIAGYGKMRPDFVVIKTLTELLDELKIGDYEIKLNHRKLLDGMLGICGVPPEKFRTICSSIDKLDKKPFDEIKKEMVEEKGLNFETADRIGNFVKKRGCPLELLFELKQEGSKFLENNESLQALDELELLFKVLEKTKCIGKVVFDLSLARGLDYYTGVIFEAVLKGATKSFTQVGSIAAGGRYDNLIGMLGAKQQVPAVGVSLGMERVFQILKDQNETVRATETEVLVSILGDDLLLAAELVSECWAAGLKADYLLDKRVMNHIECALKLAIPWMVIVGERELNKGIVKLKDVVAHKELEVSRNEFVEELRKRLSRQDNICCSCSRQDYL